MSGARQETEGAEQTLSNLAAYVAEIIRREMRPR
jgi:hypothetical protein